MPTVSKPHAFDVLGHHTESFSSGPDYVVPSYLRLGGYTKSWNNTPSFFTLRWKGTQQIATNTFVWSRSEVERLQGQMKMYQTLLPNSFVVLKGPMQDTSNGQYCNWALQQYVSYDSSIEAVCSNKLLKSIKGASVNLAQSFAERKQTADLLASTAVRLANTFRHLRRGNLSAACAQLKVAPSRKVLRTFSNDKRRYGLKQDNPELAANSWLELQYGWKPLLQDVYGSAELLADSLTRPEYKTVSERINKKILKLKTYYVGLSDCVRVDDLYSSSSSYKLSCTFRIDSQAAKTASQAGITNPALLAWELLPYSFVIDWFLPIGNFLENIDATAGCTFVRGTRSGAFRYRLTSTGKGRQNSGANGNRTYEGQVKGELNVSNGFRYASSAFPDNPLPQLKNPFSLSHVANGLALLTSAFKR